MPDPLLSQMELERDYARAQRDARFYGAEVWREGERVFFRFDRGSRGCFLARLECDGYPLKAPDLAFLDPTTRAVATDPGHFPPNSPLGAYGGVRQLCVSGTRWFESSHRHRSTREEKSLVRLLGVLALCCDGWAPALRRAYLHRNARPRR